jgi:hypothetical protein
MQEIDYSILARNWKKKGLRCSGLYVTGYVLDNQIVETRNLYPVTRPLKKAP